MAASMQALFLGGRSGVGGSTVALEVSRILAAADIAHALIEGDGLDQAHPEPWRRGIPLAERNLAALWRNYREAGWTRVIYTNTVSVLELPRLTAALGGEVDAVHRVVTDGRTVADVAAEVVALSGWVAG
jgi:hypothetical protein